MPFVIKRIYAPPSPDDGKRILVDRLWPRGMSKERAALYEWMKDIAPSSELRRWFGHMTDHMGEFADSYRMELDADPAKQRAAAALIDLAKEGNVTLLYAARDPEINHAKVLAQWLEERARP